MYSDACKNTQTKSKKRIADHGEVFTADREVNAMLDLVKQETLRIDSRFLEPACGDGNFLAEILRRKLAVVNSRYGKNVDDYERYLFIAASSIYGVDILPDNVKDCHARLFDIINREYTRVCGRHANDEAQVAIRFVLTRNIQCGDVLTMKTDGGNPLIFSEWSMIMGGTVKRRDFRLDHMLEGQKNQLSLESTDWIYDDEVKAMIPLPIREFPPIHFKKVHV